MNLLQEVGDLTQWMSRNGWNERNAGNLSVRLRPEQLAKFGADLRPIRSWRLNTDARPLAGETFLVTASGGYFKNIRSDPEKNLGVLRIGKDGDTADLLWGFAGRGRPTSELAAHLLCHAARLAVDPAQRVVLHCHPLHLLTLTIVHPLEDRALTRTLWKMHSECVLVFPEGVGVLPWMVCGGEQIAQASAEKLTSCRLLLWGAHGAVAVGDTLDQAFGLIETAEKAAEVYLKALPLGIRSAITDDGLAALARAFEVEPREGYLERKEGRAP